jgi:hypothetical protein
MIFSKESITLKQNKTVNDGDLLIAFSKSHLHVNQRKQ